MYKYFITLLLLVTSVLVGCDTGSSSKNIAAKSFGTAKAGPIVWEGAGHKWARSMITYKNDTRHTFKTIQIQCIAKNSAEEPISDFLISYSEVLGHQPILPGTTKIKEAVFDNGSQVKSVSCSVERANM